MRLMATLEARRDAAYQNDYHYKLAGRIWQSLEDTKYDEEHNTGNPNRFSYSNPFPPRNMEEGDERRIIFASVDEELLSHIAQNLLDNPTFNIGEMPFTVTDLKQFELDVGEPGTKGVLESGTGLHVTIKEEMLDRYNIESEGNGKTYWRPKHTIHPFKELIEHNLQMKHELYGPEYLDGPAEVDWDLFNEYDMFKQFAVPLQVSHNRERQFVLQKWKLGYQVKNDTHRKHLNLALNVGLGALNGLGLGFMNIKEGSKTNPAEQQEELINAHPA